VIKIAITTRFHIIDDEEDSDPNDEEVMRSPGKLGLERRQDRCSSWKGQTARSCRLNKFLMCYAHNRNEGKFGSGKEIGIAVNQQSSTVVCMIQSSVGGTVLPVEELSTKEIM
jgi:hypothetical protein